MANRKVSASDPIVFSSNNSAITFPKLPKGTRRQLIFNLLSESEIKQFKEKGYDVVLLLTLPRDTAQENITYLRLKARGIEEGTVDANDTQLDMLKLQFKESGLLDENRGGKNEDIKVENQDQSVLDLIKDFDPSRHTVDQSTLNLVFGDSE